MRECTGWMVLEATKSQLRVGDPSTQEIQVFDVEQIVDFAEIFGEEGPPLVGDCVDVVADDQAAIVELVDRPLLVLPDVQLNGFTHGMHECGVFAEEGVDSGIVTLKKKPIWVGNPAVITGDTPKFRLGDKGAPMINTSEFGIESDSVAQRAAQKFTFVQVSQQSPYGFFIVGDINECLDALVRESDADSYRKQLNSELREAQLRADNGSYFVNPYTFVPFPEMGDDEVGSLRKAPPGHDRLGPERFIGSITVHWALDSPLMVHGTEDETGWKFPRIQNKPVVLGSSLKGALRSMHETLTGSCLRVVDLSFVPVYRQQMAVQDASWQMIRIDEVDDGFPRKVTVCQETRWVDQKKIHPIVPATSLTTGNTVDLEGASTPKHQRLEHVGTVTKGTGWLLLLSHSQARRGNHPYNVAAGKLPEDQGEIAVTEEAYDLYQDLVEGTDDLRRYPSDISDRPSLEKVHFPYNREGPEFLVGQRQVASRSLNVGDVLWGKVKGQKIVELSRAAIWRTKGEGSLKERIPPYLYPCDDPTSLCPSCRLFGSTAEAGSDTQDGQGAEQQSYRGHVLVESIRFSDYKTELRTMVMASPRPGSGHTYLRTLLPAANSDSERPSFNWSKGDAGAGQPRQLRGRKWYWADGQPSRDTNTGNEKMETKAECMLEGSATTTLRFENLSKSEIGGLLCALIPGLLLESEKEKHDGYDKEGEIAFVIGGGKPFGYGRMVADIDGSAEVAIFSAEGRYTNGAAEDTTVEDLVNAFKDSVPESVQEIWPDLAAVLRKGHVNAERIAYPSLEFFKKISGSNRDSDQKLTNDLGRKSSDGSAHTHRPPRSAQQYWKQV